MVQTYEERREVMTSLLTMLRCTAVYDQRQATAKVYRSTEYDRLDYHLVRVGCYLLALLTNDLLAIKTDLVDGSAALAIGLDVLDELGDAEQIIHLLEGQTFGLGNEEPDEEKHGETEGAVDEERSVAVEANGDHHVGGGASNN